MNKEKVTNEILNIVWKCENIISSKSATAEETERDLSEKISKVAASHSNSWLGYHSRIYYKNFQPIPAGANFDIEWGLYDSYSNGTTGEWCEYDFETIKGNVFSEVTKQDENELISACKNAEERSEEVKRLFETLLCVLLENSSSKFFQEIKKDLNKIQITVSKSDLANALSPRRQYVSRDSMAASQGVIAPPHVNLQSWLLSLVSPYQSIQKIYALAKKSLTYMELNDLLERKDVMSGSKVFIGHGRSPIWRELKDFLKDRLSLQWEEFNRESVAGKTTIERLQEMLDASSFAFLIMTGEDEHANSSIHARENVVHEVGLFQGKLGFRKAIVLLEEGCEEFSNITGLSQIRFPKNSISMVFEEIRQVLEREGLI